MTEEDRAGLPEPLRENLVRAMPGTDFTAKPSDGRLGTLHGRLVNYNTWAEVDSPVEGHFMEMTLPGAFTKTFAENRSRMKIIYDHGQDRNIGRKPLGPLEDITDRADGPDAGLDYEGALLDAPYNRELLPGLKAGVYGSSYRFDIPNRDGDKWAYKPGRSDHNPEGLPEHTVREARIRELGPTPFPVGEGTSAGVRSMTAEYLRGLLADTAETPTEPAVEPPSTEEATALPGAEESHSDDGSRVEPPVPPPDAAPPPDEPAPTQDPPEGGSSDSQEIPVAEENRSTPTAREDRPARIKELSDLSEAFVQEHTGRLSPELDAQWTGMRSELVDLIADQKADEERLAFIGTRASAGSVEDEGSHVRAWTPSTPAVQTGGRVKDIYSFGEIRAASRSAEDERELIRDSARKAIESARFAHMDRATGQAKVTDLLDDASMEDQNDYVARRILHTGSPTYRRALHKTLIGQTLNPEEMGAYSRFQEFERAMGQVTGSAGGFGVTFDLDPTMIQTSTGAIVPYRRAARVVTVTTNEWRGVTSGGVVAAYAAEAAPATDNSPTLAQPAAIVQKAHCFVPFSMEIQGDYPGLEAELGREIQDAKDVLEAVQFTTGVGTTVFPQGIVTGSTTAYNLATTGVVAAADLYGAEVALAPRFRVNARWFANRSFYNRIRGIDTAGGAQLWTQNLSVGLDTNREGNTGMRLLGYPAEEASGFTATITGAGNKLAVFGDASYFVIVDRVGLNLELVPILTQQATAGTGFGMPTGQRGLYAWWRNTSKVLNAAAFETVTTI